MARIKKAVRKVLGFTLTELLVVIAISNHSDDLDKEFFSMVEHKRE